MSYLITRHDKKEDGIAGKKFESFDDAYSLLKDIYGDFCLFARDSDEYPYYEIIEIKALKVDPTLCKHCKRSANNGIRCLGMCVADNDY